MKNQALDIGLWSIFGKKFKVQSSKFKILKLAHSQILKFPNHFPFSIVNFPLSIVTHSLNNQVSLFIITGHSHSTTG